MTSVNIINVEDTEGTVREVRRIIELDDPRVSWLISGLILVLFLRALAPCINAYATVLQVRRLGNERHDRLETAAKSREQMDLAARREQVHSQKLRKPVQKRGRQK